MLQIRAEAQPFGDADIERHAVKLLVVRGVLADRFEPGLADLGVGLEPAVHGKTQIAEIEARCVPRRPSPWSVPGRGVHKAQAAIGGGRAPEARAVGLRDLRCQEGRLAEFQPDIRADAGLAARAGFVRQARDAEAQSSVTQPSTRPPKDASPTSPTGRYSYCTTRFSTRGPPPGRR
jgi:hypothetical protein